MSIVTELTEVYQRSGLPPDDAHRAAVDLLTRHRAETQTTREQHAATVAELAQDPLVALAGGEVAAALYAWVGHATAVLYPRDAPIPPGGGHAVQVGGMTISLPARTADAFRALLLAHPPLPPAGGPEEAPAGS